MGDAQLTWIGTSTPEDMNVALSQPPQVDLVDPRHDGGAPMSSSKVQGPHWPRVVHTARTPDPHGVHPPPPPVAPDLRAVMSRTSGTPVTLLVVPGGPGLGQLLWA